MASRYLRASPVLGIAAPSSCSGSKATASRLAPCHVGHAPFQNLTLHGSAVPPQYLPAPHSHHLKSPWGEGQCSAAPLRPPVQRGHHCPFLKKRSRIKVGLRLEGSSFKELQPWCSPWQCRWHVVSLHHSALWQHSTGALWLWGKMLASTSKGMQGGFGRSPPGARAMWALLAIPQRGRDSSCVHVWWIRFCVCRLRSTNLTTFVLVHGSQKAEQACLQPPPD